MPSKTKPAEERSRQEELDDLLAEALAKPGVKDALDLAERLRSVTAFETRPVTCFAPGGNSEHAHLG